VRELLFARLPFDGMLIIALHFELSAYRTPVKWGVRAFDASSQLRRVRWTFSRALGRKGVSPETGAEHAAVSPNRRE